MKTADVLVALLGVTGLMCAADCAVPPTDTSSRSDSIPATTASATDDAPAQPATLLSDALIRSPFNPLVRNGPEPFDFWKTGPRVVLKMGPSDYRMWYEALGQDLVARVGYATSQDGVRWTKQGIVMAPAWEWEREEVSPNSVIVEDGVFKMWYHAGGYVRTRRRLGYAYIGYATSTNGTKWLSSSSPVFTAGPSGSFDDEHVAEPRVFKLGNEYRMYYTGRNVATSRHALGVAMSADGVRWSRYSQSPILPPSRFGGWGGAFLFHGGIWHLWHAASDDVSGIVYRWSANGLAWNGSHDLVLRPGRDRNAADDAAVGDSVSGYLDGSVYRVLYSGFNGNFRGTGRLEAICMASIAVE